VDASLSLDGALYVAKFDESHNLVFVGLGDPYFDEDVLSKFSETPYSTIGARLYTPFQRIRYVTSEDLNRLPPPPAATSTKAPYYSTHPRFTCPRHKAYYNRFSAFVSPQAGPFVEALGHVHGLYIIPFQHGIVLFTQNSMRSITSFTRSSFVVACTRMIIHFAWHGVRGFGNLRSSICVIEWAMMVYNVVFTLRFLCIYSILVLSLVLFIMELMHSLFILSLLVLHTCECVYLTCVKCLFLASSLTAFSSTSS